MLQPVPTLSKTPEGYRHIEVAPVCGALGAEISGVDLSNPSDDAMAEVRRALNDYSVIFFRDQNMTPDQHKDFGRRFGTLNIHPIYEPLDGHPEILQVVKEADALNNIGDSWHSDATFLPEPPMGSILYAREIPPFGGDTLFANLSLAYEMLTDGMRRMLSNLQAVHSDAFLTRGNEERNSTRSTKLKAGAMSAKETLHPVVRTHPETGRKALYVNPGFTRRINELTLAESRIILDFLFGHFQQPQFIYRHTWAPGDLVIWDNRCTCHNAVADYDMSERRHLIRTSVEGDKPH